MKRTISIKDLKVGTILQDSIQDGNGKILFNKGFLLTEAAIERLRRWSKETGHEFYMEDGLVDSKLTQQKIESEVSSYLEEIYFSKGMYLDKAIEGLEICASHLYDDLKTIEDLPADCVKINYANNKGGHYFRLTKMAIALASLYNKEVSPNRKISIESISMASLLHDYGKRFKNDVEALNRLSLDDEAARRTNIKPSMLKAPYKEEYHSIYAYVSLKGKVAEDVRKTILCCNYMDSIIMEKTETLPYRQAANIIMLCDLYDTLLEHAVASDMNIPFENVISYMSQLAHNNVLDARLFKLFLKHVPLYPTGTKVLLSNGEYAVVIERTPEFPTKPTVLTLTPGKATLINLSETTNITIRRIVHSEEVASAKVDAIQEEQLKAVQIPEAEGEGCVPESLILQREVSNKPNSLAKKITSYLNKK